MPKKKKTPKKVLVWKTEGMGYSTIVEITRVLEAKYLGKSGTLFWEDS